MCLPPIAGSTGGSNGASPAAEAHVSAGDERLTPATSPTGGRTIRSLTIPKMHPFGLLNLQLAGEAAVVQVDTLRLHRYPV